MDLPSEIIERLEAGNARFVADEVESPRRDRERRKDLTQGQAPAAIVLSCADSRVAPELVFDVGLGELFVVRVAGNIANTSTVASIEYAVAHLGASLIVVMGHESCGAVAAAIAGGDGGYNLNHLLTHITPALAASGDDAVDAVVKKNAELTAAELAARSKIIGSAVAEGRLSVVPAFYEIGSGKVTFS